MKLKEILNETVKELPWNFIPKIGWWEDKKPLRLYHGTHKDNVDSILKNGIYAPKEGTTAGWVSLAFDPNTAFGYASMTGGEANFRTLGAKSSLTKPGDRRVLVLEFPDGKDQLLKMGLNETYAGNMKNREKLIDKKLYDEFSKNSKEDVEYYQLLELRLPKYIDPKFIKGITRR